eukprot:3751967-Pleurochrysis_carterae.AAC.2
MMWSRRCCFLYASNSTLPNKRALQSAPRDRRTQYSVQSSPCPLQLRFANLGRGPKYVVEPRPRNSVVGGAS